MRTMLHAHVDAQPGSDAIQRGILAKTMETLVAQIKPEATYFFADGGKRSMLFVFDLADSSQIPAIAEPLFAELGAEVEFRPVMNMDDLQRGLAEVTKSR